MFLSPLDRAIIVNMLRAPARIVTVLAVFVVLVMLLAGCNYENHHSGVERVERVEVGSDYDNCIRQTPTLHAFECRDDSKVSRE